MIFQETIGTTTVLCTTALAFHEQADYLDRIPYFVRCLNRIVVRNVRVCGNVLDRNYIANGNGKVAGG